jgi:hypothetical protein
MVNDQLYSAVSRVRRSAAGCRRSALARCSPAARGPGAAAGRRGRAHSGNPALLITTDLINLKAPDAAGAFFADVVKPDVRSEAKGDLSAPVSDFRFSLENGLKSNIAVGPFPAIGRLPDFADGGSLAALAICCFGSVNIIACRRT